MPKRIILLDVVGNKAGDIDLNYLFWLPISPGFQAFYANSSFVSQYNRASAVELLDLQQGKVYEESGMFPIPASISHAKLKLSLIAQYMDRLNTFQTNPTIPKVYGIFWNGTSWSL